MTCPNNAYGQLACQIVQHPDRMGESFCTICHRKFHDEEKGEDDVQGLLAAVAAAILILIFAL